MQLMKGIKAVLISLFFISMSGLVFAACSARSPDCLTFKNKCNSLVIFSLKNSAGSAGCKKYYGYWTPVLVFGGKTKRVKVRALDCIYDVSWGLFSPMKGVVSSGQTVQFREGLSSVCREMAVGQ